MEETSSNHDGALWLKETIAIACRALLRLVARIAPGSARDRAGNGQARRH